MNLEVTVEIAAVVRLVAFGHRECSSVEGRRQREASITPRPRLTSLAGATPPDAPIRHIRWLERRIVVQAVRLTRSRKRAWGV
jgi:hypothetical protein